MGWTRYWYGCALAMAVACGGDTTAEVPDPDAAAPPITCGNGRIDEGELCDDGVNDAFGGGCLPGCLSEDRTDDLFAHDVLEVVIDMAPSDWESMRHEYKTPHVMFAGMDCRQREVVSPYAWYRGTVSVNGTVIDNSGLRKKGHIGSQSTAKPSLKVKFSHFVPGQRYETVKRFALNNSKNDSSYMRSCLAYSVFRAAGLPAPRCTYAHVTVNNQDLGLYFAVEEIKTRFLERNFADATGNLYEGTACDFRPEFFGGFEQETNEISDPSRSDLSAVYDVVQNAADADLEAELAAVIDLPQFFRFWATESLVWHRDGYGGNANNYFVYAHPASGKRLEFIPWGPDSAFKTGGPTPKSVLASGVITNRLYAYPATRTRYYQALDDLLSNVWSPEAMAAEVDRLAAVLRPFLPPGDASGYAAIVDDLKAVIRDRRRVIDDAVSGGYPDWTNGMRSLPCRIPRGTVSASFTTTWGTLAQNAYTAGSGSAAVVLGGTPLTTAQVGARAGSNRIEVFTTTGEGYNFRVNVPFPSLKFFDPFAVLGTQPLVRPPLSAAVSQTGTAQVNYEFGQGTWTFHEVGTNSGDAIDVTFDGVLFERYLGLGL